MNKVARKNIISILLGPLLLVPALTIFGLFVSIFKSSALHGMGDTIILFTMMGITGLVFAYAATIILGLPVMLFLQTFKKFNLPILVGVSIIPASIFFGLVIGMDDWDSWLFYSYSSASVATGCWFAYQWA